jgi:hypothetical protein
MIDVFELVTEYHRALEERLAMQRERRRQLAEARAKFEAALAEKFAAEEREWRARHPQPPAQPPEE